jgi:TAZ zinc finger
MTFVFLCVLPIIVPLHPKRAWCERAKETHPYLSRLHMEKRASTVTRRQEKPFLATSSGDSDPVFRVYRAGMVAETSPLQRRVPFVSDATRAAPQQKIEATPSSRVVSNSTAETRENSNFVTTTSPPQKQELRNRTNVQSFKQAQHRGWQRTRDKQDRDRMTGMITLLLLRKRPNASQEVRQMLPKLAAKLENVLYRSAKSLAEYNDAGTLNARLKHIVTKMEDEASDSKVEETQPGLQTQRELPQYAAAQRSAQQSSVTRDGGSQSQQSLLHQQQRLLVLRHAAECPYSRDCPETPYCAGWKALWRHILECKDPTCRAPHCMSSRYIISHFYRCEDAKCKVCGPVRAAIGKTQMTPSSSSPPPQQQQQKDQQKQEFPQSSEQADAKPTSMVSDEAATVPSKQNTADGSTKSYLAELLRHTSTCKTVKCCRNCAQMKRILKHKESCKKTATLGCKKCTHIRKSIKFHAYRCNSKNCLVPNFMEIRQCVPGRKK